MSEPFVQIRSLEHRFGDRRVLGDLSFDLARGEIVSIIGPSGCGKTVLLKLLSNLLTLQAGEIRWSESKTPKLALAFQQGQLFPWLSVLENLTICTEASEATAREWLARAGLSGFESHRPRAISGGMAQRVNVLRCFGARADLILLDEPFSQLDDLQRADLQEFTLDIWDRERKTILWVTHNIDEAITVSDRILLLSRSPATVIEEIRVPFERPRSIEKIRGDLAYAELFSKIRARLSSKGGVA